MLDAPLSLVDDVMAAIPRMGAAAGVPVPVRRRRRRDHHDHHVARTGDGAGGGRGGAAPPTRRHPARRRPSRTTPGRRERRRHRRRPTHPPRRPGRPHLQPPPGRAHLPRRPGGLRPASTAAPDRRRRGGPAERHAHDDGHRHRRTRPRWPSGWATAAGSRCWRDHNALVREQVARHGGTEVKAQGDGFLVVFPSARRAILAAVDVQRALARYGDEHPETTMAVRIGLHTGEIVDVDGDVLGQNVVVAVRIADHAVPGEILVSALTRRPHGVGRRPALRSGHRGDAQGPVPAVAGAPGRRGRPSRREPAHRRRPARDGAAARRWRRPPASMTARPDDAAEVERLLGRRPQGDFEVVVRHADGSPLVIRNAPLLDDGTPMPTRYWLVGEPERTWVSRLESAGGVDRAEAEVDAGELAAAHARYAAEREAALPPGHAGTATLRRGRRHAAGRQVPARPLRLVPGRGRRPRRPVGRRAARRAGGRRGGIARSSLPGHDSAIASIDMGTNSTRVLVARPDGGTLDILDRRNTITRLGQGVGTPTAGWPTRPSSAPSPACAATARCSTATASSGCGRPPPRPPGTPPTATSSSTPSRRCSACGPSCSAATRRDACRSWAPPATSTLRSGRSSSSTSAAARPSSSWARDEVEGVMSVDVGCVRLTEKFLEHDPPQPEELTACISLTDAYLDDVAREVPGSVEARTLVGLAGTITTVAAVEMGLATYDRDRIHHFRLTRAAAEDVFRTLATEPLADRHPQPRARGGAGGRDRGRLLRARGPVPPLRLRRDDRVRGRHPRRSRARASSSRPAPLGARYRQESACR